MGWLSLWSLALSTLALPLRLCHSRNPGVCWCDLGQVMYCLWASISSSHGIEERSKWNCVGLTLGPVPAYGKGTHWILANVCTHWLARSFITIQKTQFSFKEDTVLVSSFLTCIGKVENSHFSTFNCSDVKTEFIVTYNDNWCPSGGRWANLILTGVATFQCHNGKSFKMPSFMIERNN